MVINCDVTKRSLSRRARRVHASFFNIRPEAAISRNQLLIRQTFSRGGGEVEM